MFVIMIYFLKKVVGTVNLFNVRKGQFVYYSNKLHKVYSVNPFYKKSVHLVRLKDYEQVLARSKEIELYRPQHLDSFVCNHRHYTLHKDREAEIGDFVLVIRPSPDSIDSHFLNAIEMVASIETNGIISDKSNGIKHNEYWVMIPKLLDDAKSIDFQYPDLAAPSEQDAYQLNMEHLLSEVEMPNIGDIYVKSGNKPTVQAMVIGVSGERIFMGGNLEVTKEELIDVNKWTYLRNFQQQ